MNIAKSDIVISTAGRDQGIIYYVLRTDEDYLYLIDGKKHRYTSPKKKSLKHSKFLSKSLDCVGEKIRGDEAITDSELRKAIAAYRGGNQNQEE